MAKVQLGGFTVKGERGQRVRFAMMLLTQMLHPRVCLDKLMDKYQVTSKAARSYLVEAKRILAETPPIDLDERREQMRAAFGLAYVECMAKGSHGPAVRALRELALLDGLYPASSLGGPLAGRGGDAGDTGEGIADADPALARRRMAELMDRHRERLEAIRAEAKPTHASAVETGSQPKSKTEKTDV
jgi:hypothetical protein